MSPETTPRAPSASAPRLPCGRPDRWSLDAAALVMDGNALESGSQKAHGSGGIAAGRLIQDFRDGPVRVVSPPTFVSDRGSARHDWRTGMDTQELHDRGLALPRELFGAAAVESRVAALGDFGAPLQHIINAYAYGDVWSRPGLPMATKSLAMIAMMAAAEKPAELRVHLKGALKNGCTAEEIREILLLVALYCGIPAANEAHKAAVEVLREGGA